MTLLNQAGTQMGSIAKVSRHEEYNGALNDIMIIYLNEPFFKSKYVELITLPNAGYEPPGS